MKKIVMIALIAAVGLAGIMLIKKTSFRLNIGMGVSTPGAIALTNDSSDAISVEYQMGDKKMNMQIPAGQTVNCGSNGLVRVFTAAKAGSYELTYPNDSSTRSVKLSQVVDAAKKDAMENEVYTKKGMLGDIKVMYEEIKEVGE